MNKDSLGDRMKGYEDLSRYKLMRRVPKVIRLDGKAFHTVLADAEKPYDYKVSTAMLVGAMSVMDEIGGTARMAYTQSDECSIIINDGLDLDTQSWFDNNIQKICSVASSIFTYSFNSHYKSKSGKPAYFDARVFNLPDLNELSNYLIWRQNDARRNSVQQYGRSFFSQKELHGLSCLDIIEKMKVEKNFDWNEASTWARNGSVVDKIGVVEQCPTFTEDREFIQYRYLPKEILPDVQESPSEVKSINV